MVFFFVYAIMLMVFILSVNANDAKSIVTLTNVTEFTPTVGFVNFQYYTSIDCGGSKSYVEGYYADYCYKTTNHYRKYQFSKGFT